MGGRSEDTVDQPRVLVIDDEPGVRLLLTNVLPLFGFEVIGEAESGTQGVNLAAARRPDVIVLDMGMPQPDGLATIELLKDESPDSKIVLFSSDDGYDLPKRALAAGADAYLDKLTPVDKLAETMREVFTG